jgi:hypothetical protein
MFKTTARRQTARIFICLTETCPGVTASPGNPFGGGRQTSGFRILSASLRGAPVGGLRMLSHGRRPEQLGSNKRERQAGGSGTGVGRMVITYAFDE